MANLTHIIRTELGAQEQILEISAKANSRQEAEELSYSDFSINLYQDGKHIADLTSLIQQTGIYDSLIDSVDWVELFCDQKAEVEHV